MTVSFTAPIQSLPAYWMAFRASTSGSIANPKGRVSALLSPSAHAPSLAPSGSLPSVIGIVEGKTQAVTVRDARFRSTRQQSILVLLQQQSRDTETPSGVYRFM